MGCGLLVNDTVPIEFETPLTDRDDFIFKTYVTGPDGVRELKEPYGHRSYRENTASELMLLELETGSLSALRIGYVALAPE